MPVFVEFNLDQFDGPRWLAWNFVNTSGWLQVIEATMATPIGRQSRTYAIGCNDEGVTLPSWEADFLLGLPTRHPMPTQHYPPDELSAIVEMARYDFMGECDGLALEALEGLEEETRSKLQHLELRLNQVLTLASGHLSTLRSELRMRPLIAHRRTWLREQIESLENEETKAEAIFLRERQRIRGSAELQEAALFESLTYEADVEVLYTVQFEARMRGREKQIKWPPIVEESFKPGLSQESAQQAMKDYFEDAAERRKIRAANSARQIANDAKWLSAAKRRKSEAADQAPLTPKLKLESTPKKVQRFKQNPLPKVEPKPVEKANTPKPLTDTEEHTALRAEVAALSDILRHSGRSTNETKQGLWRVTRRKQPQDEELQAIYHAIGQTAGAVEKFPRILGFLAPAPVATAEKPKKPVESTVSAWARRAEQIERIAKSRRMLSPKSKIALGKLKSGQTALTDADRNAMKHLFAQLQKSGFDVDGFLAVK